MALRAVKESIRFSNKNTLAPEAYRQRFDQQVFQKTAEQLQGLLSALARQGLSVPEALISPETPSPKAVVEKLHGFMKDFTAVDEAWLADGYALTFATKRNKLHTKVQHIGDSGFPKAKVTIFYDKNKKSDYPERMARSIAFAAADYFQVPEEKIRVQATYVTFEAQGVKYEIEATGDDYRRRDMTAEYFKDQILDSSRQARAMQLKNKIFQVLDVVRDAVAEQVDARGRKIPWEECLTNRGRISRDILIQAFNWNQDWRAYMRNPGNEQGNLEPKEDILELLYEDIQKMETQLASVAADAREEKLVQLDATIAELENELSVRREKAKVKGQETTDKIQKLEKKLSKAQAQKQELLSPDTVKKQVDHDRITDLKVLAVLALYYKAEQCLTDYEAREDVVVRQYINAYNRQPGRVLWNNFKDSPFTTEFMKRHVHRNLYLYVIFGALLSFGVLFQIPYYWGYAQKKGELQVEREDLDTVSFDYTTDTFTQAEMEGLFKDDWVAMANKYFMNPTESVGLNFKLEPQAALVQLDQDILLEAQITRRYALTRFREAAEAKFLKRISNIQTMVSVSTLQEMFGAEYQQLRALLAPCFIMSSEHTDTQTESLGDDLYGFLQDSFNFSEEPGSGQETAAAVPASDSLAFSHDSMAQLSRIYARAVAEGQHQYLDLLDSFGRYLQWALVQKPVLSGSVVRALFGEQSLDSLLDKYFIYDAYSQTYKPLPEAETALLGVNNAAAQELSRVLQRARVQNIFDRDYIAARAALLPWQSFFTEGSRMFLRPQAMEDIARARDLARVQGEPGQVDAYDDFLQLVTPQIQERTISVLPGTVASLFERVGQSDAWVIRYDFWERVNGLAASLKSNVLAQVEKLYSGNSGVERQVLQRRFGAKTADILRDFIADPLASKLQLKQWIDLDTLIDLRKKDLRRQDQDLGLLETQRAWLAVLADLSVAYPEGIPADTLGQLSIPQNMLLTYSELKNDLYHVRPNLSTEIRSLDTKIQRIFAADESLELFLALQDVFK